MAATVERSDTVPQGSGFGTSTDSNPVQLGNARKMSSGINAGTKSAPWNQGAHPATLFCWSGNRLRREFLLELLPDQAPGSFHKSQLVREATFKQHTNGGVSQGIGHRDEGNIFADPEMH